MSDIEPWKSFPSVPRDHTFRKNPHRREGEEGKGDQFLGHLKDREKETPLESSVGDLQRGYWLKRDATKKRKRDVFDAIKPDRQEKIFFGFVLLFGGKRKTGLTSSLRLNKWERKGGGTSSPSSLPLDPSASHVS